MMRPVHALLGALSLALHIGDNVPRVDLPTIRKGRGKPQRHHYSGKGKNQGGPSTKRYALWRRTRMRMQRESRRRNRR